MASVPVEISGVLYDKLARTQRPVYLVGSASIYGLGVGGGPIIPPEGGGGVPGEPVFPVHPIYPGGEHPSIDPPVPQPPDPPEVPPGTPPSSVVKGSDQPGTWGYYTDSSGALYAAFRTVKQPK